MIHLGGLSYELGTPRPIAELAELVANPAQLAYLQRTGLRDYAHASSPLSEMVLETCRRSLAAAGVARSEIGAIVYASSSYSADRDLELLPRLALELGIPDAIPQGVFLGNCANGCLALRTAHHMIALHEATAVLVVSADAVPDGHVRALADRTCVLGDGAASCVVSARGLDGYALEALDILHRPQVVQLDRRTAFGEVAFINAVSEGVRAMRKAMEVRTGRTSADYARMVTGNYNLSIIGNYAELSGVPLARLFRDNVPRISHCFASDQLIALTDLQRDVAPGERVFVLASGVYMWAGMAMRRS